MARLISRAELARLAGVSAVAITKRCKKELAQACIGRRIDRDHPTVVDYLNFKAGGATEATQSWKRDVSKPTERRRRKALTAKPEPEKAATVPSQDDDIEGYSHLTLDELVTRFGTRTSFRDWLDSRKKISDIREKDLKNDETEGRLIPRELVKTHVFGVMDAANRRLLRDAPKTIARRVGALMKSGAATEDAEKAAREIISSHLHAVKTTAARVLRNA